MKVLIVSHNAMSSTTNMGKTLLSYFREFTPEEVAQFYIRRELPPEDAVCHNFYRFTDGDALKSMFSLCAQGRMIRQGEIRQDCKSAGAGRLAPLYQYGRKRTAIIYALRNALWRCSRWNTRRLRQWLEEFGPDVVFFASGDYGFMYHIAERIAAYVQKPLVVSCVDDFYCHPQNDSVLGRMLHRSFLKTVHKTMARASGIFTICPAMKNAYEVLFGKNCQVLYTTAEQKTSPDRGNPTGIAYLGTLGLQRNEQLAEIGRTLKAMDLPGIPKHIDVYSGEQNPDILKILTPENGIHFHGVASAEEVGKVMQGSIAVLHTESFDSKLRNRLRFSVSTKIPETLMNGPCLIAYGPEGIASVDYLKENGAAYPITQPERLEQGLKEILTSAKLRSEIVENARKLAQANHSTMNLKQWLTEICEKHDESFAN